MNLEKFWLAAGAVESKDEMDGYAIMALQDGTEVAVENMIASEVDAGKWLWYEPDDMGSDALIRLLEQSTGAEGFEVAYHHGARNEPLYRVSLEATVKFQSVGAYAVNYPFRRALIDALCQRFGVEPEGQ